MLYFRRMFSIKKGALLALCAILTLSTAAHSEPLPSAGTGSADAESIVNSWLALRNDVLLLRGIDDPARPRVLVRLLAFGERVGKFRVSPFVRAVSVYDPDTVKTIDEMKTGIDQLHSLVTLRCTPSLVTAAVGEIDLTLIKLTQSNFSFAKSVNRSYMSVINLFLGLVLFIVCIILVYRSRIRKSRLREASTTEYAHSVIRAHEDERKKLSRDLHDTVVQDMTGMKLKTENLYFAIARRTDRYNADFDELVRYQQECIEGIRRVCYDLRPPELDYLDLRASVNELCDQFTSRSGIECSFGCSGSFTLTSEQQINVYRIVQESLSNIRKHSLASRAWVEIVRLPNGPLTVVIGDDGIGLSEETVNRAVSAPSTNFGIKGIKERADILGGTMTVERPAHGGTEIRVQFALTAR